MRTVYHDGLPKNDAGKFFSGLDALDLLGYPQRVRQEFLQNPDCKLKVLGYGVLVHAADYHKILLDKILFVVQEEYEQHLLSAQSALVSGIRVVCF